MRSIRTRLRKLESSGAVLPQHLSEASDEVLIRHLWRFILPLCPKHGIQHAPEQFPGLAQAERILGDSFNPILEDLTV